MFFGTVEFLVFVLLFFAVLGSWGRTVAARRGIILAFSLFFYGYWGIEYLPLLVGSGLAAFVSGYFVAPERRHRKVAIWFFTILILLPLLGFKYLGWVAQTIDDLAAMGGISTGLERRVSGAPEYFLILPLGISFYTFQALSDTFDVYRGDLQPTREPGRFLCYLAMFPQLVAGPIVRAADILDQLGRMPEISREECNEAWGLISKGFFKKLVVADTLGILVNAAFVGDPAAHGGLYWWFVAVAFGWQIYGDFSGYSDIAIGLGLLMGYRFPENFRHPYLALSFREFWGRWHISLSTWFRDYMYIPQGGNRCGPFRHHVNLWTTMVVSGIWHGASWSFVIWALIHAFGMSAERMAGGGRLGSVNGLAGILRWLITFAVVNLAWVFFRGDDSAQSWEIVRTMLDPRTFRLTELREVLAQETMLLMLGVMFAAHGWAMLREKGMGQVRLPGGAVWKRAGWSIVMAISLFHMGSSNEFIYFQF